MRSIPEGLKKILPAEALKYPDMSIQTELRSRLSDHHDVSPDKLCLGSGSSELIDVIAACFGQRILNFVPTFYLFEYFSRKYHSHVEQIEWPWIENRLDFDESQMNDKTLVWICNPNNPTGHWIEHEQILELASKTDALIALDENFAVFKDPDKPPLAAHPEAPDNLISIMSFSKVFGIPGLRLGYAIGNADHMAKLEARFEYYHINAIAAKYGLEAFDYWDEFRGLLKNVGIIRDRLSGELDSMGFEHFPSHGNWISLKFDNCEQVDMVDELLTTLGVIGSPFFGFEFSYKKREPYFRMAIPTEEEYPHLIEALRIVKEKIDLNDRGSFRREAF